MILGVAEFNQAGKPLFARPRLPDTSQVEFSRYVPRLDIQTIKSKPAVALIIDSKPQRKAGAATPMTTAVADACDETAAMRQCSGTARRRALGASS